MSAVTWAHDDILVFAAGDSTSTTALHVGEVTPEGCYVPSQRVDIASASPFRLVSGGAGHFVALCFDVLPMILCLRFDAHLRRIASTSTYSLEAPVASVAAADSYQSCMIAFLTDELGIAQCAITSPVLTECITSSLGGADTSQARTNSAFSLALV